MSVLWYTVPIAIALALSVVPIVAVLLLLLSADPLRRSVPFAVGSVLGIAVLVMVFALLVAALPASSAGHVPRWTHVVEIVVGVGLMVTGIILAVRGGDTAGKDSGRLAAVTGKLTPMGAFGFGLLLNVRPKSITLTLAAGVAFGTAPIDPAGEVLAVILFAIVGGASVLGLVIAYAIGQERVRPGLERLKAYLSAHSGVVVCVALLGSGVVLVVVGAAQLLAG